MNMLPINWLGSTRNIPRSHNVFTPANLGSPAPMAPVKSFFRGGDAPATAPAFLRGVGFKNPKAR